MNNSRTQGSAFVVVIIILTIAVIGALGFVLWQNIIQSKNVTSSANSTSSTDTPNQSQVEIVVDPNEGYLVLEDWGVKFKLPKDSGEVLAYKNTMSNQYGTFESYSLTTKRVEGLGQRCASDANEGVIRLSSIDRRTVKQEHYSSALPANNNEPINGYYYYVSGGQSICSEEHTDWQSADNIMTSELLSAPVPVR
jgi:hypothetical protein